MTSSPVHGLKKMQRVMEDARLAGPGLVLCLAIMMAGSIYSVVAEAQSVPTTKAKPARIKRSVKSNSAKSTTLSSSNRASNDTPEADEPQRDTTNKSESAFSGEDFSTSEYRLELNDNESRFLLTVYAQMSQFSYVGESLLGSAIEVSALYALNHDFAAGVSIAQALDPSEGLAILYTGIRAAGSYAVLGTFVQREAMLNIDGKTSYVSTLGKGPLMAFDFGLEQLIFNGTSRIIPATGFSAGLRYDASFWGATWSVTGRYGQLIISEKMASVMTFGGGVLMRF